MKASKGIVIGFWFSTLLFALQIGFTAYAQLRLPQVAAAFTHLGFPSYFRVELSWAKFAGLLVLLLPIAPARLKEWAYAGFAITLVSALVAHLAMGEGVKAWGWAVGCGILWSVSYVCYRQGAGRSWSSAQHAGWRGPARTALAGHAQRRPMGSSRADSLPG